MHDGKIQGHLAPTGVRPTFMGQFARNGVELPKGEFGIPPEDPKKPVRPQKGRFGIKDPTATADASVVELGLGRAVRAGGMVYVSSVGPIEPEGRRVIPGGIKERKAHQILDGKFPERVLELAVKRMLPGGPLKRQQMTHLRLYKGPAHPHEAQNPEKLDIAARNPKNIVRGS